MSALEVEKATVGYDAPSMMLHPALPRPKSRTLGAALPWAAEKIVLCADMTTQGLAFVDLKVYWDSEATELPIDAKVANIK
jgi:hypothetical protein